MPEREPLLLLSGLLSDGALWRAQVDGLAAVASQVIPDLSLDDTIAGMARRALAAAPPRFALACLSMGGYVALEIMRQAPGRVSRLALLGTSARTDTPEQAERRREAIRTAEEGAFDGVADRMLPNLLHPDRLSDEGLASAIRVMAGRLGKDGFLRKQRAIMGRIDSRPHLPRIACPTLVLCGREDASTPLALSEEMAALVPGARRPAPGGRALRPHVRHGAAGGGLRRPAAMADGRHGPSSRVGPSTAAVGHPATGRVWYRHGRRGPLSAAEGVCKHGFWAWAGAT